MRARVIVLGDVMLDVVVQPTGAPAPTSDTPANIRASRGGSGANVAIALHASGHDVAYVGARGDDAAGDVFADALVASGVTPLLETVNSPTGTVVSVVSSDGQRSMMSDRGANSSLSEAFVRAQLEDHFDHMHVSGYVLLDPATRSVGVNALLLARERGVASSVDVCSVGPLRIVTPEVFLEATSATTQLFANEEEALALGASSDVDLALDLLCLRFGEVVVTRGGQGALAGVLAKRFRVPSVANKVLDTTGAGDAATGAYLGARLSGEAPLEALERAMDAAAKVVGGLGALG